MADLASRIIVETVIAFFVWIGLLWMLRPLGGRLTGVVAALLSWMAASLSAAWIVPALKRTGFWPFV